MIINLLSLGLLIGADGIALQHADAKKNISPEERFKTFETVLTSIPSPEDSLVGHPFARFLFSSIAGIDASADTSSYMLLCRRVRELKTTVSSALANASRTEIEEALFLAKGLYRIGYEYEALMWLSQIDRLSDDARIRARARRLMIFHGALSADTLLLDKCTENWDTGMLSCNEGKDAAVALLCALYLTGADHTLARLLDRLPGPEPYRLFFRTIPLFKSGHFALATRLLHEVLGKLDRSTPASLKFTVLMLAVKAELRGGSREIAVRELGLLSKRRARYVRDWSLLTLANTDWERDDLLTAQSKFGGLCEAEGDGEWKQFSCRMAAYMERYREAKKGMNR